MERLVMTRTLHLRRRFLTAYRDDGGEMARRGFTITPGRKVHGPTQANQYPN